MDEAGNVVRLEERGRSRSYTRRLFVCSHCSGRTFKVYVADEGKPMVECASCESDIALGDLFEMEA